MTQWYYANTKNERQGPVDAGTIQGKLGRGELNQSTLVWCDGMAEWQPISAVAAQLAATANVQALPERVAAPSPLLAQEVASDSAQSPYAAPAGTLSVGDGTLLTGDGGIVYAGFWRRVAANVIDGMIVNAISFVLLAILLPVFGFSMAGFLGLTESWGIPRNQDDISEDLVMFQLVLQLVLMALTCAYYAWFHASHNRATLGKMAVGIKVVRLDGEKITLGRGIGRYFAFVLSSFTVGIGFLMAGFTQRKQALHDIICGTLVVDKWAFTDRPDLQQKGLGAVTIVVLVLFGLFLVALFFVMMALIAAAVVAVSAS